MTTIRDEVERGLRAGMASAGLKPLGKVGDELMLLDTGLDSLGLAMLVVSLEERLGYDPFTLMEEPVYPRTLGEFVALYERFAEHRR